MAAQTRAHASRVVKAAQATSTTKRFCESYAMSVQSKARIAASLAKGGAEGADVMKLVEERAEHLVAQDLMENLKRANSKLGGSDAVAKLTEEEIFVKIALDNDRSGKRLAAGLDGKIRLFQSWLDTTRPQDKVQLLVKPKRGWQKVPDSTLRLFIQQVGDGKVPKGGYFVDADTGNAHVPKVRGVCAHNRGSGAPRMSHVAGC